MRQVHVEVLLIFKAHLYGVVERLFPVVQSLSVPYLSEVGMHRFIWFVNVRGCAAL